MLPLMCVGRSSSLRSFTWNFSAGLLHVVIISSGSRVLGGAAVSICKGDAICDALLFTVGVILIIRFWSAVTGKFYDIANVIVSLDHFLGEEGTPQGFVLLYCLLPFNFQGVQMSFKVEDQVELYRGKSG